MKKTYIITFSISVLSLFSIAIISLMLMLPQQSQILEGNVNTYEAIKKSEYTYEATKNLQETNLVKDYSITSQDILTFKNTKKYTSGNSDPFIPLNETTTNGSKAGTTTTTNTNGTTTTTGTNTTTSTTEKTTNSNGGVANPVSTNK